jgi:hypothetical protein
MSMVVSSLVIVTCLTFSSLTPRSSAITWPPVVLSVSRLCRLLLKR